MDPKKSSSMWPDGDRPYFFLSYANPSRLFETSYVLPDPLVSKFFGDLLVAVRGYASTPSGQIQGFFNWHLPPGSDHKESLSRALGTAQVFVPLYSAVYLAKSLPGREWACFRRRVELAGQENALQRFVPVLWGPLREPQDQPGFREALELGADEPGYVRNGLRAMLKIPSYRDSYRSLLDRVAKRVVEIAEETPIQPSKVPDIDAMKSAFTQPPLATFAIETAFLAAREAAGPHQALGHDQGSADWRPFPEQDRPLIEYAREVAERLDFAAKADELETISEPDTRRPGIILIDPLFIADELALSALKSAVRRLPRWVLPLLILEHPDDPRARDLADQVRDILKAAGALPTATSHQAANGVRSLDEFLAILPRLVIEAERQYLQYRSGRYRPGPKPPGTPVSRRPMLSQPTRRPEATAPQDRSASPSDSLGDTKDA
jgi:FxsC-like protein